MLPVLTQTTRYQIKSKMFKGDSTTVDSFSVWIYFFCLFVLVESHVIVEQFFDVMLSG